MNGRRHISNRAGNWMFGLLLLVPAILCAQKELLQFRVSDNNMRIRLSRNLTLRAVDSFIIRYNLGDIGLYRFMQSGKDDSLVLTGWTIDDRPEEYVISKPLASADPGAANGIIFTPVPTADDWRVMGGNRVMYGINDFKDGREFKREKDIVYFRLEGFDDAKKVRLAGNFTNWQHGAFPMKKTGNAWTAPVQLAPGQYYYKFIVGEDNWMTDPKNNLSENDGRGNENSVLFVTNRSFHLKGHADAKKVFVTGNFSNWSGSKLPLKRTADGWTIELYLGPGTWTYYFIVDGKPVRNDDESTLSIGEPYQFLLPGYESARNVVLAGEFTDWKKDGPQMTKTARGWELPYVLGPGNYQYKFIVDGNWITDPANSFVINDGKGNLNSFLVIGANYTFRLKGYANAGGVSLAGDFNSWSPEGVAMKREGNEWVKRIYLAKGKHLYKFLVDGKWILDPANKSWEENESGTGNSVLWLEADVKK